jgi:hypothetical protein
MSHDIEDSIRNRANGTIESYIEQIGSVNTTRESGPKKVVDFFLGDDDTSPIQRFNDGEFGGSLVVEDGEVVKATVRLGNFDVDGPGGDPFLLEVRTEELVGQADPPADMEVDVGDFRQGVPHIRYSTPVQGDMTRASGGVPVPEFGRFLVRVSELFEDKEEKLQAIAAGEAFEL